MRSIGGVGLRIGGLVVAVSNFGHLHRDDGGGSGVRLLLLLLNSFCIDICAGLIQFVLVLLGLTHKGAPLLHEFFHKVVDQRGFFRIE